jgi:hypothetical protein
VNVISAISTLRDYTNIKFKILIVVFSILGALSADIFLLRLGLEFLLIAPSDHKQFGSQSRARHAFNERVLMLWFLLPRNGTLQRFLAGEHGAT